MKKAIGKGRGNRKRMLGESKRRNEKIYKKVGEKKENVRRKKERGKTKKERR